MGQAVFKWSTQWMVQWLRDQERGEPEGKASEGMEKGWRLNASEGPKVQRDEVKDKKH